MMKLFLLIFGIYFVKINVSKLRVVLRCFIRVRKQIGFSKNMSFIYTYLNSLFLLINFQYY